MDNEVKQAANELKDAIVSIAGVELQKAQSEILNKSITWQLEFDQVEGESAMILRWQAVNSKSTFLECLVEQWTGDTSKKINFNIIAKAG